MGSCSSSSPARQRARLSEPRRAAFLLPGAALSLLLSATETALGDAPPRAADPAVVKGVVRPAREPGDGLREAASALLFIPRKTVEYLFLATGTAAGLVRDEQVVPRVEELVAP